jgi:hypothetical protein
MLNDDRTIKEQIEDRLEGREYHWRYTCTTDRLFGWIQKLIKRIKEIRK